MNAAKEGVDVYVVVGDVSQEDVHSRVGQGG